MNTDRSDKKGTYWWSFLDLHPKKKSSMFDNFGEAYHQGFCVNRLLMFIGASVLIGALKLRNTYT